MGSMRAIKKLKESMDVIRVGLEITDAELTDMRYHKMKRNLQRIGG